MARIKPAALILVAVSLALSGTLAAFALDKDTQTGIAAYQAKNYADAVASLEHGDQKNSLVRYYLALSYQGLGNFKDAESQYEWVYSHGKDKDLQRKALQGMQGLYTMNKNRRAMVAGSVPHMAGRPSGAAASSPAEDLNTALEQFSKAHNVKFNTSYTPGCPRHY
jgi:hypothetical protein